MTKAAQTKRELCVRRLSEIYDTAKKVDSSTQYRLMFLACYPDVAQIVHDFELAHLKIIQEGATDFKAEDKIRAQVDKMRYWIKAVYSTMGSASQPAGKITLPQFSGDFTL